MSTATGAVTERLLQRDAHEPVGAGEEPLGGQRRAQNVRAEGFPPLLVLGSCAGCGVEAETRPARKGGGDDDAGTTVEDELAAPAGAPRGPQEGALRPQRPRAGQAPDRVRREVLESFGPNEASYSDAARRSTQYRYRVRVLNVGTSSAFSNIVSVRTSSF
jgi:hypothetical protein